MGMRSVHSNIVGVIPAYNEAGSIRAVVSAARPLVDRLVVVDDGSEDGTARLMDGLDVTVLRHGRNRGKAASLWSGFEYALETGATAVLTLDADGQHPVDDIPLLLEAHADRPAALIVAARLRSRHAVPGLRRFANGMANFWISWAAGRKIGDTQSGFRLYPAAVLRGLRHRRDRYRGFVFESEILIDACRAGFSIEEVPIEAVYPADLRPSHFRHSDTARIVRMVAGKLLRKALYPRGLWRVIWAERAVR